MASPDGIGGKSALVTGATSKLGHVGVELCRSQDLYRGKVIATINITQNGHVLSALQCEVYALGGPR